MTGLGESKNTKDSLFHIVQLGEGVLDCGGNKVATEGAAVTLTRLDGGDPSLNPDGTPCIPINYDLTRSGNTVDFIKDAAQDPSASFKVEVNAWDPEPAANPIPASTVFPPAGGADRLVRRHGGRADDARRPLLVPDRRQRRTRGRP